MFSLSWRVSRYLSEIFWKESWINSGGKWGTNDIPKYYLYILTPIISWNLYILYVLYTYSAVPNIDIHTVCIDRYIKANATLKKQHLSHRNVSPTLESYLKPKRWFVDSRGRHECAGHKQLKPPARCVCQNMFSRQGIEKIKDQDMLKPNSRYETATQLDAVDQGSSKSPHDGHWEILSYRVEAHERNLASIHGTFKRLSDVSRLCITNKKYHNWIQFKCCFKNR